jgi:methylated-DNA-[protein]-cysteine S-methyltransferase
MVEKISGRKQASPLFIGLTGDTRLGKLWIAVSDNGLVAIEDGMSAGEFRAYLQKRFKRAVADDPGRVGEAARQLQDYLAGKRVEFDLPIDWSVLTPFQQAALRATCAIPAGETRTYNQLAEQIGHPHAARAVGRAEATNPLPLVIPCHRVVGTDGKLHGYGFGHGLETKTWLQKMEKAAKQASRIVNPAG